MKSSVGFGEKLHEVIKPGGVPSLTTPGNRRDEKTSQDQQPDGTGQRQGFPASNVRRLLPGEEVGPPGRGVDSREWLEADWPHLALSGLGGGLSINTPTKQVCVVHQRVTTVGRGARVPLPRTRECEPIWEKGLYRRNSVEDPK